jgi:hypothetical protein
MAEGITLSTTSNLSDGSREMIKQASIAFEPAAPDPDLWTSDTLLDGHDTRNVSTMTRLTQSAAITEGMDVSAAQQLVSATLKIEPTEHAILVTLSKRAIKRQGDQSLQGTAGEQMAVAQREREAKDIIALYSGASKQIVGAGNAIDVTHFRGGVAYLLTDNSRSYGPAQMPLIAALHIEQISDIIVDISDAGVQSGSRPSGFGVDLLQRWWKGSDRLHGVQIFHSGYIALDSGDDAIGAIGNANALVIVDEGPDDVGEETDRSHRVVEFSFVKSWGEGEKADPHFIGVTSDAAATV